MTNDVQGKDSDHSAERAAEEARRREEARRAAEAERRREEAAAAARELANQAPWALDARNAQGPEDLARLMEQVGRLSPEGQDAFFESLASRNDVDGAIVAACREKGLEAREVARALVGASYPPGSERRAQLGEALRRADGSFVPGMRAEALDSAAAAAIAALGDVRSAAPRGPGSSATLADSVEPAPAAGPFAASGVAAPPAAGAPGYSPEQLMQALQARGPEAAILFETEGPASTLRTEQLDDGSVNCLERAFELARPGDSVLLCRDTMDAVGHAVVLRADGTVADPNAAGETFADVAAWRFATGNRYEIAHDAPQEDLAAVFALAPGRDRDQAIAALRLQAAADLAVADARGSTFMMKNADFGGGGAPARAPSRPPVRTGNQQFAMKNGVGAGPARMPQPAFQVRGGVKIPRGVAPRMMPRGTPAPGRYLQAGFGTSRIPPRSIGYGSARDLPRLQASRPAQTPGRLQDDRFAMKNGVTPSGPADRPFVYRNGVKVPRGAAPRATHVPSGPEPRTRTDLFNLKNDLDVQKVHPRMTHGYGGTLTTTEAIDRAGRLSEAVYSPFGTEEADVFATLDGLSRGDVQKVAYHYEIQNNPDFDERKTTLSEFVVEGSMLYSRLHGELDENPLDWARAEQLMRGDTAAADAVAVKAALDKPWILGGGGADVLEVLRTSRDPMGTIESFAKDYAKSDQLLYAGLGGARYVKGTETAAFDEDPTTLFKNVLEEKLGANEYAEAVKLIDRARATNPAAADRLAGEATAARLVSQLDRLLPDRTGAMDVLSSLSPQERSYLGSSAAQQVDALLESKLTPAQYSQATSYIRGDSAGAQAQALHEAVGRMSYGSAGAFPAPDVPAAERILDAFQTDGERQAAMASFESQYGMDFSAFVERHVTGGDKSVLLGLAQNAPDVIHAAPAVTPLDAKGLQSNLEFRADVLRRSAGQLFGVDEDDVREAFAGLTPRQAMQVAGMPLDPADPAGGTLQDELTRWHRGGGGRFGLELEQMLDGDAWATGDRAELIDEARRRYTFETSGLGSQANEALQGLFGSDTRARLDADLARLNGAEYLLQRDPGGALARSEADRALAYMGVGQADYVNSKELTASTAKTVGTAAAVIATTAVTGGGAAAVWAPILAGTTANVTLNQLRGNANGGRDHVIAGLEGAATGIVLPGNAVAVKGARYVVREAVVLEGGEVLFRNVARPLAREAVEAALAGEARQAVLKGGQALVQVGEQRFAVGTFGQTFGQALRQNVAEGVLGSVAGDLTAGTLRGDVNGDEVLRNALLSGGVGAVFTLPQMGTAFRNAKPAETPLLLARLGELGATPRQVATVESLAKTVDPRSLGDLSPAALHNLMSVPPEHAPALAAEMAQLGRSPKTIDRALRGLEPADALAGNELRAAQGLQRSVRQALQPTPQEVQALAKGMGAAVQDGLPPEAVTITVGGRVVTFKPASYEAFVEQSTRGGTNLTNPSYGDYLLAKDGRLIGEIEVNGVPTAHVDWPRPAAAQTAAAEAIDFGRFRQLYPADKRPASAAQADEALAAAFSSARWGELRLPGGKSVLVKVTDAPPLASGITPKMQEAIAEGVRRFQAATGVEVGGLGFREVTPRSDFWHTVPRGDTGQPLYPGKPAGALNPSIPKWVPRSRAFDRAQFVAHQLGLSGQRLPDGSVATQLELAPAKWVNLATTPHAALDGLPPAADAVDTRLYAHRVDLPDGTSRYVLPGERVGTVPEGGKLVKGTRVDVVRLNWEDGRVGFKLPDGTVHFYQKIVSDLDPSYVVRTDGVPLSNSETILLGEYVNQAYRELAGSHVSLFRHGPDSSGVNIPAIEKKYSLWKDYADKPVYNLGPNGEYLGEARFLSVLKTLPSPPDLDEALHMIEEQTRLTNLGWDADRVWNHLVEIARRHERGVADPSFIPQGFASRIREASVREGGGVDPDYPLFASVTRGDSTQLVSLGQHEMITNSTFSQLQPGDRVRLVHYQLDGAEPSENDVFAAAIFDGLAERGGFQVEHAILAGASDDAVPFSVDAYRLRYPDAVAEAERAIGMGALDLPHFLSRVDARKRDLQEVDAIMNAHGIPGSLRQDFHDYLSMFKASPDDHFTYQELSEHARDFKEYAGLGGSEGGGWSADRGERGRRRDRGHRR